MIDKKVTIANPQLILNGGDITRDALGLSIGAEQSSVIEDYNTSLPSSFSDGIKTGYEYAYRLIGSELVKTDKHWLSFVYGGTYAEQVYDGIFSNNSFADHHHIEMNPYSLIETKQNKTFDKRSPNYISCKPEINQYYPLYENSIQQTLDVKTIPNGYFLIKGVDVNNESLEEENGIIEQFRLGRVDTNQESSQLKNIFITSDDSYESIDDANNASSLLPYYVKTEMDFDGTGKFMKEVANNNFQHRFIKILKDSFLEQSTSPAPTPVTFNLSTEQIAMDGSPETQVDNLDLKAVDVFELMNYSLTSYNNEEADFEYLYDESEIAKSQYNNNSVRRFEKTIPTIKQTNSLIDFLNSSDFLSTFEDSPINLDQKYNEIVAYRIEKIGGLSSGDRFTQEAIQNFWFLNTDATERLEFLDNQVLFNQDYTYNIYKYVLIAGIEYSYSDLAVTRTIANLDPNWCLEFFNPATSNSSAPVYDDGRGGVDSLENTLASDAQVTSPSNQQYLADFRLRVLPSIKIVEVPLLTKQISIVDSPTNSVQVTPTYTLDDSNRLIFKIRYDIKVPSLFPTPVSSQDADYKQKFMTSYDLLETELVRKESATLPLNLEIYRIEQKPNSMSDFDGNLYKTVSMKIPDEHQAFRTLTIADKVQPNKKYFYFFRVLNEAQKFGAGSNIIQAELVSDGGYKFGNFEAYFENELGDAPLSRTIKGFKKLLNVSPSISNLIIDDSQADYSDLAKNQIQNINFGSSEDVLWDKKYKIRLTSKKTGKKIDINITHKLVG